MTNGPERLLESLVVLPGCRAGDLAVDQQPDLQRGVRAAADEESDIAPLDRERLAGQLAGSVIAIEIRVDQAVAEETADGLLIGKATVGGLLAKGVVLHLPLAVSVLEILEDD